MNSLRHSSAEGACREHNGAGRGGARPIATRAHHIVLLSNSAKGSCSTLYQPWRTHCLGISLNLVILKDEQGRQACPVRSKAFC